MKVVGVSGWRSNGRESLFIIIVVMIALLVLSCFNLDESYEMGGSRVVKLATNGNEEEIRKLINDKLDILNKLADRLQELGQQSVIINVDHGQWLFSTRWPWDLDKVEDKKRKEIL